MCDRCGGLMVTEWSSALESMASRCIQCGELIDSIILENRRRQVMGLMDPQPALSGEGKEKLTCLG
jgi:hypothetical protein